MVSLTRLPGVRKAAAIAKAVVEPFVVFGEFEARMRALARALRSVRALTTPGLLVGLIRRPFRVYAWDRAYRAACRGRSAEAVLLRYIRRAGRGRPVRPLLGRAAKP